MIALRKLLGQRAALLSRLAVTNVLPSMLVLRMSQKHGPQCAAYAAGLRSHLDLGFLAASQIQTLAEHDKILAGRPHTSPAPSQKPRAQWMGLNSPNIALTSSRTAKRCSSRFLVPFRKVVESRESVVIHCRAPELHDGARCGSLNIAA